MDERDWLAERFEENRTHLKAVAYRMLGSLNEADDAVQEAWIRLGRSDADEIQDLRAWLTTVVARVSLNMLRSRKRRREESMDLRMPDPIIDPADGTDPEHEALLADSVGLALLIVLETLTPAERLSFVLHDMFGIRFEEIGQIIDRSPQASRQLANRARHKVRDARTEPDPDLNAQREVVDAFLAAAREGDFERLVAVLDPDVVSRGDFGGGAPLRETLGPRRSLPTRSCSSGSGWRYGRRSSTAPWVPSRCVTESRSRSARSRSGRQDRRAGLPRRSRAPGPARPDHPRRLKGDL